jgi:hypothetical protein
MRGMLVMQEINIEQLLSILLIGLSFAWDVPTKQQ